MTSREHRARPSGDPPRDPDPSPAGRAGPSEWSTLLGIAACALLTWASRSALSVDGVAYLDLARAARQGEWGAFVQGYWSPLFPAIIALCSFVTGTAASALLTTAHLLNLAATTAALLLFWWWGRRSGRLFLTPTLLALFLLASNGLPRIEAVTPDVLLLSLMAWVSYELLVHRGSRPFRTGLALGLSFLAKTSLWPWLLLSVPLRLWGADDAPGRRRVLISSAMAFLLAATWIVPLSVKSGGPTFGSAGRLNYDWYIRSSDSRTPDTHTGRHRAAHTVQLDSVTQVQVLDFAAADRWTYAPWSDPTAWSEGIESSNAHLPGPGELLRYWGRQARRSFGSWMLPVLLGVLLPLALARGVSGLRSWLRPEDRSRTVVRLLGLAGILQFVAVHSEPRLIAPFVLLFGAAMVDALLAEDATTARGRFGRLLAVAIAWGLVSGWLAFRVRNQMREGAYLRRSNLEIAGWQAAALPPSGRADRIVVAGDAMPAVAFAFVAGVHIVAQMPPVSLERAQQLPPDRQSALFAQLFAGKADIAWIADPFGRVRVVPIPPR